MKVYTNLELSKGYEHWKASLNDLGPEMRAVGMKIIFFGCEADDENKVHMIVEMPSIDTAKKFMKNPEIKQKRVQAGVTPDSRVVIPLAD